MVSRSTRPEKWRRPIDESHISPISEPPPLQDNSGEYVDLLVTATNPDSADFVEATTHDTNVEVYANAPDQFNTTTTTTTTTNTNPSQVDAPSLDISPHTDENQTLTDSDDNGGDSDDDDLGSIHSQEGQNPPGSDSDDDSSEN